MWQKQSVNMSGTKVLPTKLIFFVSAHTSLSNSFCRITAVKRQLYYNLYSGPIYYYYYVFALMRAVRRFY